MVSTQYTRKCILATICIANALQYKCIARLHEYIIFKVFYPYPYPLGGGGGTWVGLLLGGYVPPKSFRLLWKKMH